MVKVKMFVFLILITIFIAYSLLEMPDSFYITINSSTETFGNCFYIHKWFIN